MVNRETVIDYYLYYVLKGNMELVSMRCRTNLFRHILGLHLHHSACCDS